VGGHGNDPPRSGAQSVLHPHRADAPRGRCPVCGDRILIWTASGDLLLLDAGADEFRPVSHLRPFEEKHPDSLAHPAFAGDRIYLRSAKEIVCFKLGRE